MAATVTFDGTRVNDADANTNWGHWGGSGGAPASEPQLRYQYSGAGSVGAVNKKATGSGGTYTGIDYDPGAGALDMESAAFPLWFLKTYVSDFSDLDGTYGIRAGFGSALADMYEYNMAGSGANRAPFDAGYPAQGGYLIAAVNPNIAAWREATNGTPDLTIVDWFGVQITFVVGGAKDVNFAIDSIDVGRGLYIVGTAVSGADLIAWDQDTEANRYGVVVGTPEQITSRGLITWGRNTTATQQVTGTDESIITFPDGYHGPGDVGMLVDLDTASTDIDYNGLYISNGLITTSDTRADFVFAGTTGAASFGGQIRNFRNVTFTSAVPVANADIECQLLTQASADISDTIIRTNAITSVACLQDPTFGTTTDLHDVAFIQTGVGHAIEIDTAGSYTLTNINFSGYGADTTDSAAIDITETTGTVTLTISGGTVPTYKTAGAAVVIVTSPVTTEVTVSEQDGTLIQNARVLVRAGATGDLPYLDSVTITRVTTVATVAHTAHGLAIGQKVKITGAVQPEYNGIKTITAINTNDYDFTVAGSPTTPATGTIVSTAVIIDALTSALGVVSDTRALANDQEIDVTRSHARKGSAADSPKFKTSPISGTIDKDTGRSISVLMIPDE